MQFAYIRTHRWKPNSSLFYFTFFAAAAAAATAAATVRMATICADEFSIELWYDYLSDINELCLRQNALYCLVYGDRSFFFVSGVSIILVGVQQLHFLGGILRVNCCVFLSNNIEWNIMIPSVKFRIDAFDTGKQITIHCSELMCKVLPSILWLRSPFILMFNSGSDAAYFVFVI